MDVFISFSPIFFKKGIFIRLKHILLCQLLSHWTFPMGMSSVKQGIAVALECERILLKIC